MSGAPILASSGLDPSRRALGAGIVAALAIGALVAPGALADASVAIVRGHAFMAAALASAWAVYAASTPEARARERVLVLGVGLELGLGLGRAALGGAAWAGVGTGLGLAGLGAGVHACVDGGARRGAVARLADQVALVSLAFVTQPLLAWTGVACPAAWDGLVARAEGGLGVQPSALAASLFDAVPPLAGLCRGVYVFLPVALGAVHGAALRRAPGARPTLLLSVFVLGLVGGALYLAFPCVGPAIAVGRWPVEGADLDALPVAPRAFAALHPRNAMPSLHTAWALVLAWHAAALGPRARAAGHAWLGLTLLATLGLGEHWLLDLVVAVPIAAAVDGACVAPAGLDARRRAIGACALAAALTGGWLFSIAVAPDAWAAQPVTLGLASVATVGLGLALRRVPRGAFAALSVGAGAP